MNFDENLQYKNFTLQVNKPNVIFNVSLRRANESATDAISLRCLFDSLLWIPAMYLVSNYQQTG